MKTHDGLSVLIKKLPLDLLQYDDLRYRIDHCILAMKIFHLDCRHRYHQRNVVPLMKRYDAPTALELFSFCDWIFL